MFEHVKEHLHRNTAQRYNGSAPKHGIVAKKGTQYLFILVVKGVENFCRKERNDIRNPSSYHHLTVFTAFLMYRSLQIHFLIRSIHRFAISS
jgi:hypothetical protein